MRDILLIIFVVSGSCVALFRPFTGLLLFIFLAFFNPHSFTWSIARTFPFSQFAALSTIVGYIASSERKALPAQHEVRLLIGLWMMFGITTFLAIFPDESLPKLVLVSKIFLMVLLATALVNTAERLQSLLRVIAFSLGFYAIKATLFVIVSRGGELVYGPENSFLAANNTIGLALAMNVPILLYLLKRETRQWLRLTIMGMIFSSYPAVIFTYSRGAWVGLLMITALFVLKTKYKTIIVPVGGLLAIVLITAAPLIAPARLTQRYDSLVNYEEDASAESRFWNWEFCRRVGMARPFGGGFDYYSITLYAKYYPEFLQRWPGKYWSCHSMWFTVLGEHGIVGFLLWLGLMFSTFVSLRRIRAYARNDPQFAWMYECADALQGALVAYMVVGSFLDTAYFDMYYFLVAIVVNMKEIIRRSRQPGPIVTRAIPSMAEPSVLRAR